MFLHEITIKNLLSFGPETPPLKLRPLNVLIGPNGSAKSNLIDVIGLLNEAPNDLARAFKGGISSWLWKQVKAGAESLAEIEVAFESSRSIQFSKYKISFGDLQQRLAIFVAVHGTITKMDCRSSLISKPRYIQPPGSR
jgi:predicted ATPase